MNSVSSVEFGIFVIPCGSFFMVDRDSSKIPGFFQDPEFLPEDPEFLPEDPEFPNPHGITIVPSSLRRYLINIYIWRDRVGRRKKSVLLTGSRNQFRTLLAMVSGSADVRNPETLPALDSLTFSGVGPLPRWNPFVFQPGPTFAGRDLVDQLAAHTVDLRKEKPGLSEIPSPDCENIRFQELVSSVLFAWPAMARTRVCLSNSLETLPDLLKDQRRAEPSLSHGFWKSSARAFAVFSFSEARRSAKGLASRLARSSARSFGWESMSARSFTYGGSPSCARSCSAGFSARSAGSSRLIRVSKGMESDSTSFEGREIPSERSTDGRGRQEELPVSPVDRRKELMETTRLSKERNPERSGVPVPA